VWGNFSEPVEQASSRYTAERSITARLYKPESNDNWVLDWRFTNDDLFEANRLTGDKQQTIALMIDTLAAGLAAEYAVDPSSANSLTKALFKLKGTQSFVDIELAKRRLESLSVVTDLVIRSRDKETIYFEVSHTCSVKNCKKALELDRAFEAFVDPRAFYHISSQSDLEYIWVGK